MNDEQRSQYRIGYARVSSVGQNLDAQIDALQQAGCDKIFTDKMTGSRMDRPGWDELIAYIRAGDTLVVTELSRMTRSLLNLLETAKELEAKQVEFISLREQIDTHTATGRCFVTVHSPPSLVFNGDHSIFFCALRRLILVVVIMFSALDLSNFFIKK